MAVAETRLAAKANGLFFRPDITAMSYPQPDRASGAPGLPVAGPLQSNADSTDFSSAVGHGGTPPLASQACKKVPRSSRGRVLPEIRRSSSTPHMRNLTNASATGDISPTSMADKRRNKLGYHRTSVACGHCRRRKIRCLMAPDDRQGRCSNCIRLRKECNFYPVEQMGGGPQAPPQHAARDTSATGQPTPPTPSSPRQPSIPIPPPDTADEFRQFVAVGGTPPFAAFHMQHDLELDPTQVPHSTALALQQPPYGYPPPPGDPAWPASGFVPPAGSLADVSPSSTTGYWRPSPPTAPSPYGSDTVSGRQTPARMSAASTLSYASHQDGTPHWVPPTRSMSYGIVEGMPPHAFPGAPQPAPAPPHQPQSHQQGGVFPAHTVTYPYPAAIDTASVSAAHANRSPVGSTGVLSAPVSANAAVHYGYPWNGPYAMTGPPVAPPEVPLPTRTLGSNQWFAEPTQLVKVDEESGPLANAATSAPYAQGYFSGA